MISLPTLVVDQQPSPIPSPLHGYGMDAKDTARCGRPKSAQVISSRTLIDGVVSTSRTDDSDVLVRCVTNRDWRDQITRGSTVRANPPATSDEQQRCAMPVTRPIMAAFGLRKVLRHDYMLRDIGGRGEESVSRGHHTDTSDRATTPARKVRFERESSGIQRTVVEIPPVHIEVGIGERHTGHHDSGKSPQGSSRI